MSPKSCRKLLAALVLVAASSIAAPVAAQRRPDAPAPRVAPQPVAQGFTTIRSATLPAPQGARVLHWTLRRNGSRSDIDLVLAMAPKASVRSQILPVMKSGGSRRLFEQAPCTNAFAVANGGFYTNDHRGPLALGLVRSGGKTLQRGSGRRSGGFLSTDGAGLRVHGRADAASALRARDAIESTPILTRAGRNDMRSDDRVRFDRVAAGTTADGDSFLVGAFGPSQDSVSLWEFQAITQGALKLAGERAQEVIAMDGGPSAHIYLPQSRRLFGHVGGAYLPNVVCLGVRGPGR